MKKVLFVVVVVAVIAIAFGTTGFVSAQSLAAQGYGAGYGNGMAGRGSQAAGTGLQAASSTQDGLLHDAFIAVFAEKLGISVEDLNARLANGETMSQIAASLGFTADQFTAMMNEARSAALSQAVEDGTLTQTQADWMAQHGFGMAQTNGYGNASGTTRGPRGTGLRQFANPDCPFYTSN
jgi:hypothetical protein